jgi:hypothetical protein
LDEAGQAESTTWPPFTLDAQQHLELDDDPVTKTSSGLRHRPCALWREVVPKLKAAVKGENRTGCR